MIIEIPDDLPSNDGRLSDSLSNEQEADYCDYFSTQYEEFLVNKIKDLYATIQILLSKTVEPKESSQSLWVKEVYALKDKEIQWYRNKYNNEYVEGYVDTRILPQQLKSIVVELQRGPTLEDIKQNQYNKLFVEE